MRTPNDRSCHYPCPRPGCGVIFGSNQPRDIHYNSGCEALPGHWWWPQPDGSFTCSRAKYCTIHRSPPPLELPPGLGTLAGVVEQDLIRAYSLGDVDRALDLSELAANIQRVLALKRRAP